MPGVRRSGLDQSEERNMDRAIAEAMADKELFEKRWNDAEEKIAKLLAALEDIKNRGCCDEVCFGPCASQRAAKALKES